MYKISDKFEDFRAHLLEIAFYVISVVIFYDAFLTIVYKINLLHYYNSLKAIDLYILLLFILFFNLFKIFRLLVVPRMKFFDINKGFVPPKDYYQINDLRDDSIIENNQIKYNLYLSLVKENERKNNIKDLIFTIMVLIPIDLLNKDSLLGVICNEFEYLYGLVGFIWFFLFIWSVQPNNDECDTTFIRKRKSSL